MTTHRHPLGFACLAIALAVAACTGLPTKPTPKPASRPATNAKPVTATAASPTARPSPLPSLGLLLEGQVTVDPAKLLSNKLAQPTATGVKLISDNGLGLISDNGLGLISDNSAGLIANNGGSYRVTATGDGLKAVEGMHVKAIGLLDGKVLAGPVATDAQGRYRLGFLKAPGTNLRVVAEVPAKPKDPAFTYATLVPPAPPAPSAAPVVTSDVSRSASSFILGVLPTRLQPVIDARKAGRTAEEHIKTYEGFVDEDTMQLLRLMDKSLAKAPVAILASFDSPSGSLAMGMSERTVAFLDLKKDIYLELERLIGQARAWGLASKKTQGVPLEDLIMEKTRSNQGLLTVPALLQEHGVAEAEAKTYGDALMATVRAIGKDLGVTIRAHDQEVKGPLAAFIPKASPSPGASASPGTTASPAATASPSATP